MPARIDDALLLADLRRVAKLANNQPFTREYYEMHGRYGAPTAARRFGGWNRAIRKAGLTPVRQKNTPVAALIIDLQRAARARGVTTLSRKEYKRAGRFKLRLIEKRFGNWSNAIEAAGLQPTPMQIRLRWRGPVRRIEDFLTDLQRVSRRLRKQTMTTTEYGAYGRYKASTIAIRFGFWAKALSAAGLTPTTHQKQREHGPVPVATFLSDLRRVARKLGKRTLTQGEYRTHDGKYGVHSIARRCGNWNAALRMAGLHCAHEMGISIAALIADLKRVARKLGKRTMTQAEYGTHGKYAVGVATNRFGSWSKALKKVGLSAGSFQNILTKALLADVARVAQQLGQQTLEREEYKKYGLYSLDVIIRRLGSWPNTLRAVGIQPSWQQIVRSRDILHVHPFRDLNSIPGLTTEDRVAVAKTVDGVKDLADEVILQMMRRLNLGPVELPSGIPSGVPFWERCIRALQKVQPDPEKLRATGVLERLGRQLHRAVALELLGREPLSPAEERRVARELQQRKAA